MKKEIRANNKRVALDKEVKSLEMLFENFNLLDYYDSKYINAGLEIDDPKIQTILTRIKGMKFEAYRAIKNKMEKVQSLRIDMENE